MDEIQVILGAFAAGVVTTLLALGALFWYLTREPANDDGFRSWRDQGL